MADPTNQSDFNSLQVRVKVQIICTAQGVDVLFQFLTGAGKSRLRYHQTGCSQYFNSLQVRVKANSGDNEVDEVTYFNSLQVRVKEHF